MRVLVTGSRGWKDRNRIHERLVRFPLGTVIVHGKALGVDMAADRFARQLGLEVEQHPADWAKHGSRAGILRNIAMIDTQPDLVLAFWDGESKGTQHCIEEARRRGLPVEVIKETTP